MKRSPLYFFVLLTVTATAFTSCLSRGDSARGEREPVSVRVISLQRDTVATLRTYTGELVATDRLTLHFLLGGELRQLNVRVGDKVREGQLVAAIDDTRARSLHDAAVAVLRQAEDGEGRVQRMHNKGAVTDVRLLEIQTELEKARQNEIATLKGLTDCRLVARSAGTIASVDVSVGQILLPGQTVATLITTDRLEAHFSVPEKDMSLLQEGMPVEIETGVTGTVYGGRLSAKGVSADRLTHTYLMHAEFACETDGLYPGMLCLVHVRNGGGDTAFVLPQHCVHTTPEGHAVWIVKDGIAERREVTVDGFAADGVRVTAGLSEGDLVITEGYQKLYPSAPVRY